MLSDRLFNMKA